MKKIVRVGSRDSRLAVAQTELALNEIREQHPEIEFEIITMKTTGDMILDRSLDAIGGKGLFVKELDRALYDGRVDITVHSLKDLPMEIAPGLPLLGFSKREDPRDAMLVRSDLTPGFKRGIIGTSSRRRMIQLKKLYPQAEFKNIRGNVQTRMRKLETEGYSATILALAGLRRLGLEGEAARIFSVDELIPAAGQGILAFQGIDGGDYSFLEGSLSRESERAAAAERAFVRTLDGGCSSPIAAYAEIRGDELRLRGLYYDEASDTYVKGEKNGRTAEAETIGAMLAEELKKKYR